jgi:predicted MPP superfamily phosphohydrolase
VSAGVGTAGLPLRLRRPPEVPVLRLTAGLCDFSSKGTLV